MACGASLEGKETLMEQDDMRERIIRHWLEHPESLDTLIERLESDEIAEDWPVEGVKEPEKPAGDGTGKNQ
jgi:hypothetical protein